MSEEPSLFLSDILSEEVAAAPDESKDPYFSSTVWSHKYESRTAIGILRYAQDDTAVLFAT